MVARSAIAAVAAVLAVIVLSFISASQEGLVENMRVKPLGPVARWIDAKLEPLMRFVSGAPDEAPQQTHNWNRTPLSVEQAQRLQPGLMLQYEGNKDGMQGRRVIMHHVPILGGWRKYVVVKPPREGTWYLGWQTWEFTQVSRISLTTPARILVSSDDMKLFALDAEGRQIALEHIGEGQIGQGGPYAQLPLL
jgi:hypothetical protein